MSCNLNRLIRNALIRQGFDIDAVASKTGSERIDIELWWEGQTDPPASWLDEVVSACLPKGVVFLSAEGVQDLMQDCFHTCQRHVVETAGLTPKQLGAILSVGTPAEPK